MNLLEIAQTAGRTYKRVSAINGGEYHGPCPLCGGNDRFHVWPHQGEHGTYWCRQCGKSGDAVQYLIDFEGKSFPEACKELGRELPEQQEYQAPAFKKPSAAEYAPRQTLTAGELWQEHALKLLNWSHEQLLANKEQLQWLEKRGLDLEAVKKYRLGWNPGEKGKDLYRAREAWGLDTLLTDKNRKKKLWLPIGLVIPFFQGEQLQRIRIRRQEGAPRYYFVPGSSSMPTIMGPAAKAYVIVESELDALLIHHLVGDLVGIISLGNSSAKPDVASFACLKDSLAILVSLDSDESGMAESIWWKKHFPQAERHPVPVGKDPGEAFAAGIDIREWVKIGLPPIFTLPKAPQPPAVQPPSQDDFGAGSPASSPEGESEQIEPVKVFIVTAADGRQLHITDDPAEYHNLCREGKIVFNSRELEMIRQAGFDKQQAARLIDMKETLKAVLPGGVIEKLILPVSEQGELQ